MKFSLVMATKNPTKVQDYITQALWIAPLFDEVVVHNNMPSNSIYIPQIKNLTVINEYIPICSGEGFNKAIAKTTGDWILCLCDDDVCDYKKLAQMIQLIKSGTFNDKDIIVNPFYSGSEKKGWELWPRIEVTLANLKEANRVPFTSFYKKSVWEEVKGYKNVPFSDWFFWMEAAKKNKKFVLCNIAYFYFRYGHLAEPSLGDKEALQQKFELTRQQLIYFLEKS